MTFFTSTRDYVWFFGPAYLSRRVAYLVAPHVHVGLVEFVEVACYVLIFTLLWRALAARLNQRHPSLAGAMTAVYS